MSAHKTAKKTPKKSAPAKKPVAKGKKKLDAKAVIAAARKAAFTDETPAKAFAHFRPLAEAVDASALTPFTGQPLLMRANVMTALRAVEPHLERAVTGLFDPKLEEVFELPALVMALDFAANRVPIAKLSPGEIDQMLREGAPLRELMLSFLEIVAHPLLGLLPRERVAAVRAGKGKLDQAQDFVAIPGLFAEFEDVIEGKHPFPADTIDKLATLGGTLLTQVRPGHAVAEIAKRSKEAILRDQLAALVADRYDHLQVLAAVALGKRKADELLPALRSGVALGRTVADAGEEAAAGAGATVPAAS